MNQLICDRCGKVIEKPKRKMCFLLDTRFHFVHFTMFGMGVTSSADEQFDLCGNCSEILWDWLKKPKEE